MSFIAGEPEEIAMRKPGDAPTPPSMRSALTLLLDGVAGSRKVLRHLAAVEHDLGRKDAEGRVLFDAPSERLKIVLRQLDGLLATKPPPGLAALRTCLLDAIKTQERAELRAEMQQPISSFFVDHKLQVSEARATEFDEAQAAWNAKP